MIRFECDYGEGAHPRILERLAETNLFQTCGYGEDEYCKNARRIIRTLCGDDSLLVQFLVGGTQANATVIAAALRPHQGVIAAQTGHINVHESGAIEATGHKVLPIASGDGKITAGQIRALCQAHWSDATREHMVQPAMVYLSQPTENGTLYLRQELAAIRAVCDAFGLLLYVDGARLGYGLAAACNDVTLPELARLTDAFYIGGTKVGALFGEAVVIRNAALQKDFRYHVKQRGGMLAKGRLLGLQFETLLGEELYFSIAKRAVEQALRIRDAFLEKGFALRYDSPTNQQFPILPVRAVEALKRDYAFSHWEQVDEARAVLRFCTSWATEDAAVEALIRDVRRL